MNVSNSQSLGDRLRQSQALAQSQNVARAAEEEQLRLAEEKALNARENRILRTFFDNAQRQVEAEILSGMQPKGLQLGNGVNDDVEKLIGTFRNEVVSPEHKYHSFWREFKDWAASNGLLATWTHHHDTGGIRSWIFVGATVK